VRPGLASFWQPPPTPAASSRCARFQAWQQAIERDGIDPVWATVVRLAADGFWLATLLGLWSPSRPLQQHVLHERIRLTRETPQRCRARTP